MGITNPSIPSQPVRDNFEVVIEMVSIRPKVGIRGQTEGRANGQVVGFYNQNAQGVELYMVHPSGDRWIKLS